MAGARFRIWRNGCSPNRYLLVHGNEESARLVLVNHMQTHEGVGYVVEGQTRNVVIEGGIIDPNRMFSRVGAEASLKRLNPDWPAGRVQTALNLLDREREKLVSALLAPAHGRTVALHNNSEGYSMLDEQPIGDAVSVREADYPHAFFLCTDAEDFRTLSMSPFNVVLQRHGPKEDDGSLSRLAAARGVRYVNLEVGLGHSGRQYDMLDWLERHLS
jgi:hypothetical protein